MTALKLRPSDLGPWITVKEAAASRGVGVQTINAWLRQGHIIDRYIDRTRGVTRIRKGALDAYVGHRSDPRFATGEILKINDLCDMLDASRALVRKWMEEFHVPIHYAPNGRDMFLYKVDAEALCEQVRGMRTNLDLQGMDVGSRLLEGVGGEEIIANVAEAIGRGMTFGPAATNAGVAPSSLKVWIREGRQRFSYGLGTEDPFVQLILAVDEALAKSEEVMITKMEASGEGDWKQWQYRLQRQHKEGWAEEKVAPKASTVNVNQTQQVAQQTSNETKTVVIAPRQLTASELLQQSPELFDAMTQIAEGMENAGTSEGHLESGSGIFCGTLDEGRKADVTVRPETSPNNSGESTS